MILIASGSHAQQPDIRPYETEEDLWEALREDEITFDEFLELLEIYRLGTGSIGVPESDWEALPGADAGYLEDPDTALSLTQQAVTIEPDRVTKGNLRWQLRAGYDADLVAPSGGEPYTIVRADLNGNYHGLFDLEQQEETYRWRRALLTADYDHWRVQLGSIEPRWGRGLVVGRRSRFIGSTDDREPAGSFFSPTRARFSGLSLEFGRDRSLNGALFFSYLNADPFSDIATGMRLDYGKEHWQIGYTLVSGRIDKDVDSHEADNESGLEGVSPATTAFYVEDVPRFTAFVQGLHLKLGTKDRAILAEIALSDKDATAKAVEGLWKFDRGRVHARAWSYNDRFINPWGGGPAHSDRETVILDTIGESYSTRTTGERGFSITTRVKPERRVNLRWDWMTHRETSNAPYIHHWTVRANLKDHALSLTPFARGKYVENGENLFALGSYATIGDKDKSINLRFEAGRHHLDEDTFIRTGAGVIWHLSPRVTLSPRIRWIDPDLDTPADGYWYFYFTESIIPGATGRIEAALVWQRYEDRSRDDRVELRLRLITRR